MQIEFRNISRRVCLELLVFIMQIDRDIKLGILLLEQSCTDTTAVFLLENKAQNNCDQKALADSNLSD